MYAFHYGVISTDLARFKARFYGHEDPTTEAVVVLNDLDDLEAVVSGSWKCWGTADQAGEGDDSLHVLVLADDDDLDDEGLPGLADELYEALNALVGPGCRLLDYVVVSDGETWSEQQVLILRDGGSIYMAVPNE